MKCEIVQYSTDDLKCASGGCEQQVISMVCNVFETFETDRLVDAEIDKIHRQADGWIDTKAGEQTGGWIDM